jgi:hypothetical protein
MNRPIIDDDRAGGEELSQLLRRPSPEVWRVSQDILVRLTSDVRVPVAAAALTVALAELIAANASPPSKCAEHICDCLLEVIAKHEAITECSAEYLQ